MEYTQEQLKAACALNLCTVSVSQIIDYDDINVMEQEYEAILNNLNLEQMPKDEALLNILKQILDTITFFRIHEVDKQFVEREYQQKMKNAIWSAVPNAGLLVAGGNPVTMAISLASQVGIGYMNYRRVKSEATLQRDKERWGLERTAIEQFNGLRRELFDTAWRLSETYNFPDRLRLTERQITQYDNILMDGDLLRKYDRLDTIKDEFAAYPPFWYNFGNTANSIARSALDLSDESRQAYLALAKGHFEQYRKSNSHALLREDPIAAACALELVDLLDFNNDCEYISKLLEEAVRYSGRANDVLQLASVAYLKMNDFDRAANLLRQLVNEQYNTVMNAQLLSSIYVGKASGSNSADHIRRYETLANQVGAQYLLPLPADQSESADNAATRFFETQKGILTEKCHLVIRALLGNYLIKFGKLIPVPDVRHEYPDTYFLPSKEAVQSRKHDTQRLFASTRAAGEYLERIAEANIPYGIIDLMNELYEVSCGFCFMSESAKESAAFEIEKALKANGKNINDFAMKADQGQLNYLDIERLLDMKMGNYTANFFTALAEEADKYVRSRTEMQDIAIMEESLEDFCSANGLNSPSELYESTRDRVVETIACRRFSVNLLGDETIVKPPDTSSEQKMVELIKEAIPATIRSIAHVDFFTGDSPKKERYFRANEKLSNENRLIASTLAILDDLEKKGDTDLIFTVHGIVPIVNGARKKLVPYDSVEYLEGKEQSLRFGLFGVTFANSSVKIDKLNQLIKDLSSYAPPLPESIDAVDKPGFKIPFAKKE